MNLLLSSISSAIIFSSGGGGSPTVEQTITVPLGTVTADLTDFPLMVDLAHMSSGFWDTVNSTGGNIRAYAADGVTLVPHDLTAVSLADRTGRIFIKKSLLTGSDTVVILSTIESGASVLPVGDANGRNAVWSNFEVVWVYPSGENRTGNGYAQTDAAEPASKWITTQYHSFVGLPHQGIVVEPDGTVVTIDTNYLRRHTSSNLVTVLASNANPVGDIVTMSGNANLNHLSDGCVIAGELWVPCNEYPMSGGADEFLAVFNLSTLVLDRVYDVSAQGRHISGIAYDPATGTIYASDYLDGSSLMKYNTSATYLGALTLSETLLSLQGLEIVENRLIASGITPNYYTVGLDGTVAGIEYTRPTAGFNEGLSYDGTSLWVLDGDGDVVKLGRLAGKEDWRKLHYDISHARIPTLTTTWTMATSVYWTDPGANLQQGFMCVADGLSDSNRATTAFRAVGTKVALWNSTDSWANGLTRPLENSTHRYSTSYDGTARRKLFVDGIKEIDDAPVSARPVSSSGTGFSLVLNGSKIDGTEEGEGYYQTTWFTSSLLSEAWLKADADNNLNAATFYTVT